MDHLTNALKYKVGLFSFLGILLIFAVTYFVNDKPFWWRPCNMVWVNIDDATGLKYKSSVLSLGLQVGYLKNVELHGAYVRLGVCITAPVEVLPETKASIKSVGILGDKFVELKPVRHLNRGSAFLNVPAAGTQSTTLPPIPTQTEGTLPADSKTPTSAPGKVAKP
jgi:ABC-type transporter Mla subunit MlaD